MNGKIQQSQLLIVCICAVAAQTGFAQQGTAEAVKQTRRAAAAPREYMGREIAQTMHYTGAEWLTRGNREQEERCSLMLDNLGIKQGMTICDMGCGNGFYTLKLAQMTGETGKVYAVDIQPEMIKMLRERASEQRIRNITPVLGVFNDPRLPKGKMDLILLVDVYHEFSHPFEMMQSICKSLKSTGKVIFVEFRGEDPEVPIKPLHKMTEAQVRKEMSVHPLEWRETIKVLPRQHIIIFQKKP